MRNERLLPSKKTMFIMFGFLLAMMVLGSFLDFQISNRVYNESNFFGIFFAAYGEYPALLGLVSVGTMLLIGRNRDKKFTSILQILLGGFLLLSSVAMTAVMPGVYISLPKPVIIIIGILSSLLVIFLVIKLCSGADRKLIIRIASMIFFIIFAEMLVVNLIKIPWGRARMRLIAIDDRAYFMHWWQIGGGLKEILVAVGVKGEEFKSFPSGHTANATMLMLLGFIPLLKPEWKDKKDLLYIIGFVWGCLVAFSRVIIGAHFLTDTVVGLTVGFVIILIAGRIMQRTINKNLILTKKL